MTSDQRSRIVIVDDSHDYRRVLEIMLEMDGGFEVTGQAADGREGIEVVSRLQPDAVLLDVSMPRMDGLEAIPAIREQAPDTVVIMLTGFASQAVRERALLAGAHEYLDKGEEFTTIMEAVRTCCAVGPTYRSDHA